MFSAIIKQILPLGDSPSGTGKYQLVPMIVSSVTILYLGWRLWTFTIKAALRPDDPKEVPYLIPGLGHAVSMFRDSEGFFGRARVQMGNRREPFGLCVAGEQFYIITSPEDVTTIYNNKKTLTFDEYIQDMLGLIGSSADGVQKMWTVSERLHKNLAHAGEDFYRQQFLPGREMDLLWATAQSRIDALLQPNEVLLPREEVRELSLHNFCRDVLLDAVVKTLFGDVLISMAPNYLSDFLEFDDESWKLIYQLPPFLAKNMLQARNSMTDTLEHYFKLPKEKRAGAAWLVQTLESEMRIAGIADRDIACFHVSVTWTALSNAYKLCFWLLAYILSDASLYRNICAEVIPVVSQGASNNLDGRIESDCPRLIAAYNESLRLTTASASIRTVASPTRVGNVTLRAGSKVLLPFHQLHIYEKDFGSDADHFRAERFLENPKLVKSPSFRPFGGGVTYCPGRYLARREVLLFVATVLQRYQLSLVEGQRFPRIDEKKPCLGVMTPTKGDDYRIRVKVRSM